jgi:hypothetical protein
MTKTIDSPEAPTKHRDLPAELAALEREYVARWRTWAHALATGRSDQQPTAREVLDAGLALGHASPADQLSKDADVIRREAELVAELKGANKAVADFERTNGPTEAIRELVQAAEKELVRLSAMLHQAEWLPTFHSIPTLENDLAKLRAAHPHLLGDGR